MNWQPIETAPKDGTCILAYLAETPIWRKWVVPDTLYAVVFWEYDCWRSMEVEDCGTMGGELTGWMPDWVCIDVTPTHWMPLPKAPK